jgi:hypothetical protein
MFGVILLFFLSCYHKIQREREREREIIYKWDKNGKRPIEEAKKMKKSHKGEDAKQTPFNKHFLA